MIVGDLSMVVVVMASKAVVMVVGELGRASKKFKALVLLCVTFY